MIAALVRTLPVLYLRLGSDKPLHPPRSEGCDDAFIRTTVTLDPDVEARLRAVARERVSLDKALQMVSDLEDVGTIDDLECGR
jgi:hypothetical protein